MTKRELLNDLEYLTSQWDDKSHKRDLMFVIEKHKERYNE